MCSRRNWALSVDQQHTHTHIASHRHNRRTSCRLERWSVVVVAVCHAAWQSPTDQCLQWTGRQSLVCLRLWPRPLRHWQAGRLMQLRWAVDEDDGGSCSLARRGNSPASGNCRASAGTETDAQPLCCTYIQTVAFHDINVVNYTIVTDPTIRQSGFHLPRHTRSLMNHFRTGQGPYCAYLHKWGLAQSPFSDCGRRQTMNHIVDTYPPTKF